jgi:tripartite-type tricarboxylate transporter receptor subunit TctC
MRKSAFVLAVSAAAFAATTLATAPALADAVEDFYKKKRVTLYVGYSPGGGYDRYSRTLARHMGRHIPGKPSIIVKNRPGAGSMILTNELYNSLPKDGSVFGNVGRGLPQEPLMGTKEARYDSTKFTWIGSMNNEVSICASWHKSEIKTVDDMLTKKFVVGGVGPGSDTDTFPTAINNVFGAKIRIVTGYPGGNDINFAIERGELDGRCGWSWSSVKSTCAKWLKDKKIHLLVQMSTEKHPDMPDVPFVLDLAKNADQRATLAFIFSRQAWGRPYMAPPGVPADRAKALQDAFMATMKDPKFLADANKQKLEIAPLSGPKVASLIKQMYDTPRNIVELAALATSEQSKMEIAKAVIPVETMEGKITESKRDGRSITVEGGGKKWKVSVSGSKTAIMVAGKKAKRKALQVGMACKLTYQGTLAKAFDCQ